MAVTIRFTKAAAKPKKPKQSGSKKKVLTKLNSFLKQTEPETVEFLYHDLQATGNAVTYKELREAYLAGGLTQDQLEKWQHKYSKLVTGTLKPKWEQAAAQAAQEIKDKYPYFLYEPGAGAAADWIKQHGAELVTNLAQDQMDALNAMVGYFSGNTAITPDEAARMMRPCIGLTKPQALANIHYQDAVKAAYLKQHPKAKQETLDKKAKDAGARYAARQHRYRAQSIARTELAYGYNAGAYGATKDAQAQGYIGECKKKWLTAYDERVCPICSAMDEETVDMDAPFSNGKLLPPGHPQCRCAVAYEETDNANLQPQAANGTMNAQNQPQSAPQQPTAAQPAAAQPQTQQPPLVQTTPADPNAPQIPPDVDVPPGMTYKGPANLGGTGEMHIYEDADGKQWLFKPAQDKGGYAPQEFRAYAQEAGYKVQSIVDPSTAVPVGTDTLGGKFGAYQERLNTLDEGGLKYWQKGHVMGWEDYDLQDTDVFQQLQREHATDWLLGNYDSHGGNFVTRIDGQLIGIDKEQAFKYISDPKSHTMSYTYHPNAKYGETEPVYNTLFRKYAKGDIDLDLNDSLKYIQRVEQIPDAEYREIFRSYAESLHGPGADAEKLLDAIVERKANLRETYRAFYSELETERNGVKTVFQFSDEIAGTATPKPVPKPKTPKAPKNQAVTPKPTKTPVKTDGGYMVSDVMDDMTILPNTQNGVAIHSDGGMLEQMNLRGRRITINGVERYEISGKLTEDTWEAVAKNAKSRGFKNDIEFLTLQPDGTYITKDVGMTIDGFKIMDTNQSVFEVYADYVDKERYSLGGYFRVRIDATGDAAADRKALDQILDKAGLKSLTVDPTDAEELLMKKSRIAWQRDPQAMEKCRHMTGTAREKEIDRILKNAGIDDNRVRNMRLQEVYPGYSTYIDDAATMDYRQAGATHIWHGVGNKDSVVAICKSDGLTASQYRATAGMKKCGASQDEDMMTGGADSVFVRLGTQNGRIYYDDCSLSGRYRIIIDSKELNRTDWYAHEGDRYGVSRAEDRDWQQRPSSPQFVADMKKGYRKGNELMFRHGIKKESFVGVSCDDEDDRYRLIQAFKDAGMTEVNGINVEDFVQVHRTLKEDVQRGIEGLSYYTAPKF